MEISHPLHRHPLFLSDEPKFGGRCSICGKRLEGEPFYACVDCRCYVHKSCAQLPVQIQLRFGIIDKYLLYESRLISPHVLHAMHPQHVLSLGEVYGCCNHCKTYGPTWTYHCLFCEFYLHTWCLIESSKDAQNLERLCFLCGKQHLDSCIDVCYFINQLCIELPEEIEHKFHSHKLLLMIGVKDIGCDSCHKRFDTKSQYGCEECNFRMDVKCALMRSIQYEERDEAVWPVVPPHFNHQHPLRLIEEVYDINCTACHTTKVSPIYGCFKCDYFLHQSCLELPIQFSHPLHDSHVLSLQPLRDDFCRICGRKYDGFGFGCIQCRFFIGIECIFEPLPSVIVLHKCHPHPLYLIERSYCNNSCNADNAFCHFSEDLSEFKLLKSYLLRCFKCDYNLHLLCGPLPCTIKHKSHLHVLKLEDYIVEDDLDEHYCDVCEEIRSPRLCAYYCGDCQFFAHVHCVISEIINVFKTNSDKVELRIVGDLRLEDRVNPSHNNLSSELLLDLLKQLNADEVKWLKQYFPHGELFPREKEDPWESLEQQSSSDDVTMNIKDELSFYNDHIWKNIAERLKLFKPCPKYHIQPNELALPIIEVKGYKVTSNFSSLLRTLLRKYFVFGSTSGLSNNADSVVLYFLCRVLRSMSRTFIVDITDKQLFTWLYYLGHISDYGFDLQFFDPFLERIIKSYFGLQAMKFESKAPERLDQEIDNLEQKISDIKSQVEELKWHRQNHKPGKIAAESIVMREFFTEAKEQKWQLADKGIF